eukprot:1145594-Pelagomonas_calceolata.AAC.2
MRQPFTARARIKKKCGVPPLPKALVRGLSLRHPQLRDCFLLMAGKCARIPPLPQAVVRISACSIPS